MNHLINALAIMLLAGYGYIAAAQTSPRPTPPPPPAPRGGAVITGREVNPAPPAPATPPAPEFNPRSWREHISAGGGYTILLPGQPKLTTTQVEGAFGPLDLHAAFVETGLGAYGVLYTDYPPTANDAATLRLVYNASRDRLLARPGSPRLVSERDVYLDGRLGREIVIANQDLLETGRFFLVNSRLYQVVLITTDYRSAGATSARQYESFAARLFDSFRITNPPAPRPLPVASGPGWPPDPGKVENAVYTNRQFGLTLPLPRGWRLMDARENESIMEEGRRQLEAELGAVPAGVQASISNTVTLLTLRPTAEQGEARIFMIIAERIQHLPLASGQRYLTILREFLRQTAMKIESDIYQERVGGVEFDVIDVSDTEEGVTVRHRYYVTLRDGYALNIILTYVTEDDLRGVREVLAAIRWQ